MRLRTIGRTLAYASMLVALLSLGYSLSCENRYLRVSHLINFDPLSKHFVNSGLIAIALFGIMFVGSLLLSSSISGPALGVLSSLLLGFQIACVIYAVRAMPRSIAMYRRIWEDGKYSGVVEAAVHCCGYEKTEESRGSCSAKKTCQKKLTQQAKERLQRLWHGLGVSMAAQVGLVVATIMVVKGGERAKEGYEQLLVGSA